MSDASKAPAPGGLFSTPAQQQAPPSQITTSFVSNLFKASKSGSGSPTNRLAYVSVALIVILLLVLFIVWLVRKIGNSGRTSVVLSTSVIPLKGGGTPLTLDKAAAPPTINGQEFCYSFWLYLNSIDPSTQHKLLFLRSTDAVSSAATMVLANASPIVYLDQSTNKLYISIPTTNFSTLAAAHLSDLVTYNGDAVVTVTVDYVPLQRWVNVSFCVQDNMIVVYIDGDIYAVYSIPEFDSSTRPVFNGTTGTVQIGDASNQIDGFVTKLTFMNYAITQRQASSMYRQGPAQATLFSRLGLPPYEFRTPIYRTDQPSS